MEEIVSRVLHYAVEALAILVIGGLALAYMTVGGYETPIIIAAMGAVSVIAGYETHKREQNKKP